MQVKYRKVKKNSLYENMTYFKFLLFSSQCLFKKGSKTLFYHSLILEYSGKFQLRTVQIIQNRVGFETYDQVEWGTLMYFLDKFWRKSCESEQGFEIDKEGRGLDNNAQLFLKNMITGRLM